MLFKPAAPETLKFTGSINFEKIKLNGEKNVLTNIENPIYFYSFLAVQQAQFHP